MTSRKKMKVLGLAAGIALMMTLGVVAVAASHSRAGMEVTKMACGCNCGGHGMAKDEAKKDEPKKDEGKKEATVVYTCPMHPEVVSDKPGQCPKCGMNLVPKK